MQPDERAINIACRGVALVGILSLPAGSATRGVVIVVGGPQVRTGSHRQFTLLARTLAATGTPVLRFDYRGMGDSDGPACGFEDAGEDLRAAIDSFQQQLPELREIVLLGLCDGAAAGALYAPQDQRVRGLVLLNPWVRTEESAARATLKHYYGERLRSGAVWRRLARGGLELRASARSIFGLALRALRPAPAAPDALPARLHAALARFGGHALILLAGADLTAREFGDLAATRPWRRLLQAPRFAVHWIDGADHTFSQRVWHDQVAVHAVDWMRKW